MSAPDLILPGFYGKIPATGDFVGRRLPADFVRQWDRWLARHLVPLLASGIWEPSVGLRFLLGESAGGPMAGVMLPSSDRAGRVFPLTVAAPLDLVTTGLATSASKWFDDIQAVADAAQADELSVDGLEAQLALLPFPAVQTAGGVVSGMVAWATPDTLREIDPEAPLAVLKEMLAERLD